MIDAHENAMGFSAIRVHYSADPEKDPMTPIGEQWLAGARKLFPDPLSWAQEMELNFWVSTGTRVYPEFSETNHVQGLSHRPRKVVYRSWDFGWHTPACLVAQVDTQDRLVILREVVGREETTKEFAQKVITKCAEWYPMHTAGFQDFCDPAGQQRRSTAESSETRDVEILNSLGIYPTWKWGWSRKHGRSLVHQLLAIRTTGTPGLLVDGTQCPTLLQGFLGKYVYPEGQGGKIQEEPDESNHPWADVHACLRYLVTGLYSALGLRRDMPQDAKSARQVTWHGYGTPNRGKKERLAV